jgi:hypothetical protein
MRHNITEQPEFVDLGNGRTTYSPKYIFDPILPLPQLPLEPSGYSLTGI